MMTNRSTMAGAGELLGRLLVASLFWFSGVFDMALNWPAVARFVGQLGLPAPVLLAAGAMIFEIVVPVLLFVERLERFAWIALALYCLATALLFHKFWLLSGFERTDASFQFFKNMALAGSFALLAFRRTTEPETSR